MDVLSHYGALVPHFLKVSPKIRIMYLHLRYFNFLLISTLVPFNDAHKIWVSMFYFFMLLFLFDIILVGKEDLLVFPFLIMPE
jgi:hypothetical protein